MKTKLLLMLLFVFAITAGLNAQDQEQTATPKVEIHLDDTTYWWSIATVVTISHDDPNAEIYFRYCSKSYDSWTEWMDYFEDSHYPGEGIPFYDTERYVLETYAISPGKTSSEIVSYDFDVYSYCRVADFGVDGIYYKFMSDSTVEVSMNYYKSLPYVTTYDWFRNTFGPYSGDVLIPETVEYQGKTYTVEGIDTYAFINCQLTSITLPNTLKSISREAFINTTIESGSILIPASVTNIEECAFFYCYDLENVQVDEDNPVYDSRDNCNAIIETATNTLVCGFNSTTILSTISAIGPWAFGGDMIYDAMGCSFSNLELPNSIKTIGDHAFAYCSNLASVTIPNSVISIGESAFLGCDNLASVNIPNSVTAVGEYAFANCCSLVDVTISNSITEISKGLFSNCTGITEITIPNSVTRIDDRAFDGCSSLSSISIPNSVTEIGEDAFYKDLASVHVTDLAAWCMIYFKSSNANPLNYAHRLFLDGEEIKDLVIPESVITIRQYAFSGCTELTSAVIPNSVTSIENCAFLSCSGLTSVSISNSVTEIGISAFGGCSGLTNITIPNSVTYLSGFNRCTALTSVIIGESVNTIGDYAFDNSTGLTKIVCHVTTPPVQGKHCFYDRDNIIYNNVMLYVPNESLEAYRAHEEWGKFSHIVPFIGGGPGDVDGDGSIGINDVTNVIDMIVSDEDAPAYCDVDGDGIVGINDVTTILDMLLAHN